MTKAKTLYFKGVNKTNFILKNLAQRIKLINQCTNSEDQLIEFII